MKAFIFLALVPVAALAQTYRSEEHSFRVVKVVEGLQQPWSLAFLPDGRMLVTEKAGRLRIVAQGKLDPNPVDGLPASLTVHGQGGLHEPAIVRGHAHDCECQASQDGAEPTDRGDDVREQTELSPRWRHHHQDQASSEAAKAGVLVREGMCCCGPCPSASSTTTSATTRTPATMNPMTQRGTR